ncbi:MAG TPA: hypothetical protein VEC35_19955 [Noviherbaspirillum sp.]|nr:hypothetical protein [Noviherbaspirillum sp.]
MSILTPHHDHHDRSIRDQSPRARRGRTAAKTLAVIGTLVAAAYSFDTVYAYMTQSTIVHGVPKAVNYMYAYPFDFSMMVAMMAR